MRNLVLALAILLSATAPAQSHRGNGADDVLQYLPYAAVVGLKTCGVQSRSAWDELALRTVGSWAVSAAATYGLKHTVSEWRPDHTDRRSFPSGHAAFAFAGATVLRHEYGHLSPWVSVAGYGLATLTAADRVVRHRHYLHDAAAGAAVGILSGEATCYLSRRFFGKDRLSFVFTGSRLDVNLIW